MFEILIDTGGTFTGGVLIEQNVPLALKVSDYAYILSHGEIIHRCTAKELAADKQAQAEHIGVAKRYT